MIVREQPRAGWGVGEHIPGTYDNWIVKVSSEVAILVHWKPPNIEVWGWGLGSSYIFGSGNSSSIASFSLLSTLTQVMQSVDVSDISFFDFILSDGLLVFIFQHSGTDTPTIVLSGTGSYRSSSIFGISSGAATSTPIVFDGFALPPLAKITGGPQFALLLAKDGRVIVVGGSGTYAVGTRGLYLHSGSYFTFSPSVIPSRYVVIAEATGTSPLLAVDVEATTYNSVLILADGGVFAAGLDVTAGSGFWTTFADRKLVGSRPAIKAAQVGQLRIGYFTSDGGLHVQGYDRGNVITSAAPSPPVAGYTGAWWSLGVRYFSKWGFGSAFYKITASGNFLRHGGNSHGECANGNRSIVLATAVPALGLVTEVIDVHISPDGSLVILSTEDGLYYAGGFNTNGTDKLAWTKIPLPE